MSTIRIPNEVSAKVYAHLYTRPGEHFAFFLATWTLSRGHPVFNVQDVVLIPDEEVEMSRTGWSLSIGAITDVINAAARTGHALIEIHNHGGDMPRFSRTDRAGLGNFVPYVLDSLRGRPYAATVWGESTIYAEYFMPEGGSGIVQSVLVYGNRLDQRVSRQDDGTNPPQRFDRQLPWFTLAGQRRLGRLKIAIVGLGGTGSPLVQNLVYLGVRDFLVVDPDASDETSLNRLVTATAADIETAKVVLARRLVKSVAPEARVEVFPEQLQSTAVLDALKGVDVIFGCVDNDGARVVLNEMARAYQIPYFDLGVGIEAQNGRVNTAGGRLAVVLSGGPCLHCMDQIDVEEARYWLSTEEQRQSARRMGYVTGMDEVSPSVAALNAAVAAAAAIEFSVYVSGGRQIQPLSEFDLLGIGRSIKGQWLTPVRVFRKACCPVCDHESVGDNADIERRYAHAN
jgi:molybdopterin/thiamine biosynthesis adenylyltransferase